MDGSAEVNGMVRRLNKGDVSEMLVDRPAKQKQGGATRDAILEAAEQTFGTHGFEGASMRAIAELAEVAQALLHYHFKNKEALFEAVFERRAVVIRAVRQTQLDDLLAQRGPVTLEEVLTILFEPLDELLGVRRGDLRFYVQMLAEVTISSDERSTEIVKRFYDPSAKQFVAAFQLIMPALTKEKAVWAYLFAIGARMQAHAPNARAGRLGVARGARWPYDLLVPFTAAGIRGICQGDGLK